MTETEVIQHMRAHLEGLFPKVCPNCDRRFTTLREYLLQTQPVGPPMPHDVELGDWNPLQPLGTTTYANCPCGSTLMLSSDGMPLLRLWSLLNWARIETKKRSQTPQELLGHLRDEISKQVLAAPAEAGKDETGKGGSG
jgi:hypothetical protein